MSFPANSTRQRAGLGAVLGYFFILLNIALPVQAQLGSPCGVVEGFDFPIDIQDTLERQYDDFGLYRQRFGGLHVGLDIGFNRWGDPVMAAARGRVTYSNPEGWDTEKGVVIIEHTFPDGSIAYSLYGHMEQSETLQFPAVNSCVERGDVIGGIGWPSLGRPHLHYEIRNFMPNDGGPGYINENPLLQGWYHPIDFTRLWRVRLGQGFLSATTFEIAPTLPPVFMDSGVVVMAYGSTIEAVYPPNTHLWSITTRAPIEWIESLPGDRVAAYTNAGQAIVLRGGRYEAVWSVDGPEAPFAVLGDTLVFLTDGLGLAGYDSAGTALWSAPGDGLTPDRVVYFQGNGDTLAIGLRVESSYRWRLVDGAGTVIYETELQNTPVAAPGPEGAWWLLDGANVDRIAGGQRTTLGSTGLVHGRTARMVVDFLGNSTIYLGDSDTTMVSLGRNGEPRWRASYPYAASVIPPLLATGQNCMLYTLDVDGMLNVFDSNSGALIHQAHFYAGGENTGDPRARLLRVDADERLLVAGGFLSVAMLDGRALGGATAAGCLLG